MTLDCKSCSATGRRPASAKSTRCSGTPAWSTGRSRRRPSRRRRSPNACAALGFALGTISTIAGAVIMTKEGTDGCAMSGGETSAAAGPVRLLSSGCQRRRRLEHDDG